MRCTLMPVRSAKKEERCFKLGDIDLVWKTIINVMQDDELSEEKLNPQLVIN